MPLTKKPIKIKWSLTSRDVKVQSLVDFLYGDLDLGRLKAAQKKKLLTTILMNLLLSDTCQRGIQYPRNSNWYQLTPVKYKYPFQTYDLVIKVTDGLIKKGYINNIMGEWDMQADYKEQSVMTPTEKLKKALREFSTSVVEYRQPVQTVILREITKQKVLNPQTGRMVKKRTKKLLSYNETSEIHEMRRIIEQWNELRSKHTITFSLPKDLVSTLTAEKTDSKKNIPLVYNADLINESSTEIEYKIRHRYAHRVFNNNFRLYGRYSGATETLLNKEIRPYFQINGEPTVEIDFEAFHTRMLYNLEGVDYQNDPYQAAADTYTDKEYKSRKLFKKMGLMSLNADSETSAIKAVREDLLTDKENPMNVPYDILKSMLEHWLKVHQPIAKYLCSGMGLKLMNKDSQIAEKVINYFTNLGILVLCVHDSFIVAGSHKESLCYVMEQAYREVLGVDFKVRMECKELKNGQVVKTLIN